MVISLQGNLKDYGLARILIDLKRRKATGTLSVSTANFTKNVYMKDGNAIFSSSTLEDDRLGEMLVKAGRINVRQYERSAQLLKTTGKRQGAILVDLGYITPKDLFWGVKYQVKEIILSLFHLVEGAFEFREGFSSDEVITLKISTENLIYEGIKRLDNWTRIKREMPDPETVFGLDDEYRETHEDEFHLIDLNAEDRRILSLVNGERTIGQLIEEARLNSFDVMKTLYLLWVVGVITRKGPAEKVEQRSDPGETPLTGESGRSGDAAGIDGEFLDRINEFFIKLSDMGPDEILRVNDGADAEEIKRSYYSLAKEFHPDRLSGSADSEIKDKVTEIFAAVTKAYKFLQDDAKRREYFDSIGKLRKVASWDKEFSVELPDEETRDILLKEQFGRGIEEFKKGNFWGAAELFKWVTVTDGGNPKGWSYLSLALSKMPNKLKEAEEAILQAIHLDPFNSELITNLGLIYLKAGLKTRAKRQFEKALKLDPENARARTGLEQS